LFLDRRFLAHAADLLAQTACAIAVHCATRRTALDTITA
jgi:hypothetical protein